MGWKKKLGYICLSILLFSSIFYVLHAQDAAFSTVFTPDKPLYILHGHSAHVGMGTQTSGRMLIKNIGESVAFFSNKPTRKGGTLSIDDFVQNWSKNLDRSKNSDPNAALIYFSTDLENFGRRRYDEIIMKLTKIDYHTLHNVLEIEFDLLSDPKQAPDGNILEPTLFLE